MPSCRTSVGPFRLWPDYRPWCRSRRSRRCCRCRSRYMTQTGRMYIGIPLSARGPLARIISALHGSYLALPKWSAAFEREPVDRWDTSRSRPGRA